MKNLILFILLLGGIQVFSQNGESKYHGKLIDSVLVENSQKETYAVYLPQNYNPEVTSAIVFIFEPSARGKVGIASFLLAADTYNYILVCSNNSENGPLQYNNDVAGRMLEHVLTHYKIDGSQLYIAGFSGGSRLAGSIALNSGAFTGVIACGASFRPLDRFIPPPNKFSYVGLVGNRDMNYQEMIKNQAWLNKYGIRNELFISNDRHAWPNQKEMLRAFDWLELEAYRKGIRSKNENTVKAIYDKNLKIADSLSKVDAVGALREYKRIVSSFNDKAIETTLNPIIEDLEKSKAYKQQLKKDEQILALENEIADEFSAKFDEGLKNISVIDTKYWEKMVSRINKIDYKEEDDAYKKLKYRLQYKLRAMIFEGGMEFRDQKQNDKYLYTQRLLEVIKF